MVLGKPKEAREPPVDRVRAMMRTGMSEKDIVRQLKAEGFSFGEIEKALMTVVKAGAVPLQPGAELGLPPATPSLPPAPAQAPAPSPAPAPAEAPPVAAQPEYVEYPTAPQYPAYAPEVEEELQPEVIMEELIESVAEEKFEKFSADIARLEGELEKLRADMGVIRERAEAKPVPEVPKELGERTDKLEVRIGGLEKAFGQILPKLSENVAAISRMVAERKHQAQ